MSHDPGHRDRLATRSLKRLLQSCVSRRGSHSTGYLRVVLDLWGHFRVMPLSSLPHIGIELQRFLHVSVGVCELAFRVLRVASGSELCNRVGKAVLAGHTAKRRRSELRQDTPGETRLSAPCLAVAKSGTVWSAFPIATDKPYFPSGELISGPFSSGLSGIGVRRSIGG
jgi:hypothetical protein